MRRVLLLGFTPFSIIAVDNVMIIAMNAVLQRYGGAAQGDAAGDLRHHRAELHAGGHHAAGRHQRRHAAHSKLQLRRATGRSACGRRRSTFSCWCWRSTAVMMLVALAVRGRCSCGCSPPTPRVADQAVWAIRVCTLALLPLGLQYEIVDGFTAHWAGALLRCRCRFWRKAGLLRGAVCAPGGLRRAGGVLCRARVGRAGPGGFHRGLPAGHPPHSAAAGERPAGRMSRYSQEGRRRSSRRTLDQSNSAVSSSRFAGRSSSSRPAACASMPSSRCGV